MSFRQSNMHWPNTRLDFVCLCRNQCFIIPCQVCYQINYPGGMKGLVDLGGNSKKDLEMGERDSRYHLSTCSFSANYAKTGTK